MTTCLSDYRLYPTICAENKFRKQAIDKIGVPSLFRSSIFRSTLSPCKIPAPIPPHPIATQAAPQAAPHAAPPAPPAPMPRCAGSLTSWSSCATRKRDVRGMSNRPLRRLPPTQSRKPMRQPTPSSAAIWRISAMNWVICCCKWCFRPESPRKQGISTLPISPPASRKK